MQTTNRSFSAPNSSMFEHCIEGYRQRYYSIRISFKNAVKYGAEITVSFLCFTRLLHSVFSIFLSHSVLYFHTFHSHIRKLQSSFIKLMK